MAILTVTLYLTALIDLPRLIPLSALSPGAMLTGLYATGATLVFLSRPTVPQGYLRTFWPLLAFLAYAMFSLVWRGASMAGVQNVMVLYCFLMFVLLSWQEAIYFGRSAAILRVLEISFLVSAALYALGILAGGLGSDKVILARPFALVMIVAVGWNLARWRYGYKNGIWYAAIFTVLVALSLSRLALATILITFPLSQTSFRSVQGWARPLALSVVMIAVFYLLITHFGPLRDRFTEGDVNFAVGGIAINGSGRTALWEATLDSASESPWFGKGPGSAQYLISSQFNNLEHPHNDYLRILHDYGRIGLVLFSLGLISVLTALVQTWRRNDRPGNAAAAPPLAGCLGLLGFAAAMITDNVIVYVSVMLPLGVLLGVALAGRQPWTAPATAGRGTPAHRRGRRNAGFSAGPAPAGSGTR